MVAVETEQSWPGERILAASTFFGRLGLEAREVETCEVRKQYRLLALCVHPDKCKHPSAKEAFQLLSEAFEELSVESSQRRYLQRLRSSGVCGGRSRRGGRGSDIARDSTDDARQHWWDTRTWEEFEKRLRRREECEAALRQQFSAGQSARFHFRRVRKQVIEAERSVEHCDRGAGLPESDLWPPPPPPPPPPLENPLPDCAVAPPAEERAELDDPVLCAGRLALLLTHLRTVHRYCLFCGCVFDSDEDMDQNCPGFTEVEHDEAPQAAMRAAPANSTAAAAASAADVEGAAERVANDALSGIERTLVAVAPQVACADAMPLPSTAAAIRRSAVEKRLREEAAAPDFDDPLEALAAAPRRPRAARAAPAAVSSGTAVHESAGPVRRGMGLSFGVGLAARRQI
eukprot:TRINITY_DN12230_c0_g1_i1.p1 TRINITY_DN12230_c0_g1~~TRINITY_DN12230_c0_g1_i1.p1  ORF type:complete len:402 (-),score=97.67 TRINITY_DN12230_c0_g1_i1:185-1390(-)